MERLSTASRSLGRPLRLLAVSALLALTAALAAIAIPRSPELALALPALAAAAAILARVPALGIVLLLLVSGAHGSLVAFLGFPTTSSVNLVLAALWLALLWIYLLGERQRALRVWPGVALVVAYLGLTVVHILLVNTSQGFTAFANSGWYMLAFLLVAYAPWDAHTYSRLAKAAVLLALLVGAYATYRYIVGPAAEELNTPGVQASYNYVGGQLKLIGSFLSGYALGVWTAIVIPFCVAAAVALPGRWRVLSTGAACLCMIALIGSQLRIALAAVVVGALLVVTLCQLARSFPGLQFGRTGIALIGAGLIGVGAFVVTGGSNDPARHSYSTLLNPTLDDPSIENRVYKWEAAFADLENKPFGYGVGNASARTLESNEFISNVGQFSIDSGYLKVALEQGLLMMAFFSVALLTLMVGLARRAVRTTDLRRAWRAIGACGTLVSLMILMLAGAVQDGLPALTAWVLIGLGAAGFSMRRSLDPPPRGSGPAPSNRVPLPAPLPARPTP